MGASPVQHDTKTAAVDRSRLETGSSKRKTGDIASRVSNLKKRYPKIMARLAE